MGEHRGESSPPRRRDNRERDDVHADDSRCLKVIQATAVDDGVNCGIVTGPGVLSPCGMRDNHSAPAHGADRGRALEKWVPAADSGDLITGSGSIFALKTVGMNDSWRHGSWIECAAKTPMPSSDGFRFKTGFFDSANATMAGTIGRTLTHCRMNDGIGHDL